MYSASVSRGARSRRAAKRIVAGADPNGTIAMAAASTFKHASDIEIITLPSMVAAILPRFIRRQRACDGVARLWAKLNRCEYL